MELKSPEPTGETLRGTKVGLALRPEASPLYFLTTVSSTPLKNSTVNNGIFELAPAADIKSPNVKVLALL
jgi:hypothetical protein